VVHVTAVAIPYIRHHGDPYVFPAGVAEQRTLQHRLDVLHRDDPVVR